MDLKVIVKIKYILKLQKGKQMLLPILSGSSLILGLYLIFSHFFMSQNPVIRTQTTYHIGCYDPSNANNHSSVLLEKIGKIQSTARQSTKLNMFHSKGLRPDFDRDVRQVAKQFEIFLDRFYKNKEVNEYTIDYYNSLRLAKMDFKQCASKVYFNQKQCLRAWEEYKNSKGQFDAAKKSITELVDAKERNELALSNIVLKRPNVDQDEAQKNFKVKILQLKEQIDQSDQVLIQVRTVKNKIKLEINSIDADLEQLKSILSQCINNQELIIYCNKLTKEVQKIEQNSPRMTKKELESRISKKLLIISGLQLNIKKARRINEIEDAIKQEEELVHQQKELSLLYYQVQNFQTKEESRCAMCSEERIKQLRKNISDLENKKSQLQKGYIKAQKDITEFEIKLGDAKKQYEIVQKDRESFMITQFCLDEPCKVAQRNSIKDKERLLNELKKEIIGKQSEFNFLQSTFTTRLSTMKGYLEAVDQIVDCLRKKEYLIELKKKEPSPSQIDVKMIDAKRSIIKQLNDFQL